MKYSFIVREVSDIKFYLIESPNARILENLGVYPWTPTKIQQIVNGLVSVQKGKKEFKWANEDVHFVAYPEAVYFFDLMAERVGKANKHQDFTMSHETFITFLKDFKKFVEKN